MLPFDPIQLVADVVHAIGRNPIEAAVMNSLHPEFGGVADLISGRCPFRVPPLLGSALSVIASSRTTGRRIVIIDSTGSGALDVSWQVAAFITTAANRFTDRVEAHSWKDAADALLRMNVEHGDAPIDEVQFFGHGSPGAALIGADRLTADSLAEPHWQAVRHIFGTPGIFWFRTCESLNGDAGRALANAVADHFGEERMRVAGHTQFIHAVHPGLVVKVPGQRASWADGSGSFLLCTDLGHPNIGN